MITPSPEEARVFLRSHTFSWHQTWELASGVRTPGANDIGWLMNHLGVPDDLSGMTVLDIGTTNGGAAFEAERRGASRVVAVDLFSDEYYGIRQLAAFLRSDVEYRRGSVYEIMSVVQEKFDIVFFLGVLYHLRHPLLALDQVRAICGSLLFIETAIDSSLSSSNTDEPSYACFFRRDELAGDSSNWFAPSRQGLLDWLVSCGFEPEHMDSWPPQAPTRAGARCRVAPEPPEWQGVSYEQPLVVRPSGYASKW